LSTKKSLHRNWEYACPHTQVTAERVCVGACGVLVDLSSLNSEQQRQHHDQDQDDDDDGGDDAGADDKLLAPPSPTPSNLSSSGDTPSNQSSSTDTVQPVVVRRHTVQPVVVHRYRPTCRRPATHRPTCRRPVTSPSNRPTPTSTSDDAVELCSISCLERTPNTSPPRASYNSTRSMAFNAVLRVILIFLRLMKPLMTQEIVITTYSYISLPLRPTLPIFHAATL